MFKKLMMTTLTLLIAVSLQADDHWEFVPGTTRIRNTNGNRMEFDSRIDTLALRITGNWITGVNEFSPLTIRGSEEQSVRFQSFNHMTFGTNEGSGFLTALTIDENRDLHAAADLNVAGTTTTNILTITGGSDLAEPFHISAVKELGAIQPGMVASIDVENPGQLRISSKPYDRTVVGVISGAGGINPGMIMQQNGNAFANGEHPIALTGRVFVQADVSNGAIQPGDLLTTSSTPGQVMRVTDHAKAVGAIIGKAMTGLDAESGLVLMVVALQ